MTHGKGRFLIRKDVQRITPGGFWEKDVFQALEFYNRGVVGIFLFFFQNFLYFAPTVLTFKPLVATRYKIPTQGITLWLKQRIDVVDQFPKIPNTFIFLEKIFCYNTVIHQVVHNKVVLDSKYSYSTPTTCVAFPPSLSPVSLP